jgi:uncharacterized protein YjbI with pentapeptide repeats
MHRLRQSLVVISVVLAAPAARADIFQWEYIDPADPSQGKRQSTMLAYEGAGVDAVPGANLSYLYLTMAYLDGADLRNAIGKRTNLYKASFIGANLSGAHFTRDLGGDVWEWEVTNLTDADLSQANLSDATFAGAELTNADFTGAVIRGTSFNVFVDFFGSRYGGLTLAQLYSTASYQTYDLAGINLGGTNLTGGNFAHQNLTNSRFSFSPTNTQCCHSPPATLIGANFNQANLTDADFGGATLTDADFTGADVRGATFDKDSSYGTGITLAQLYSTASYQARDLSGISLGGNNLAGANFAGQNLTKAGFSGATLTGADVTDAEVRGANFHAYYSYNTSMYVGGIALAQLYSTASYQAHDLSGISLGGNNLAGANFAGQNLTKAGFSGATLTGADFTAADVQSANLGYATLTGADFTNAEVRGAHFDRDPYYNIGSGISLAQLYSTASYQAHDLSGISLLFHNLAGANFAGQSLTNANLALATLTGADFTGAEIRGASFGRNDGGTVITLAQLYSTASYQAHDLSGVSLRFNNLAGANLAGQNLTNANFDHATLTGADFTGADLRGAYGAGAAIDDNLIRPDGHISGLVLDGGGLLVVRDYDGNPNNIVNPYNPIPPIPITVDQHLTIGPGGTLRLVFEADAWDSTISFAPGIPVTLGGTLELTFADNVNLASQLGRTFDLFNWTGVTPTGDFAISSPYAWDLSNLYTTGQVTLTAIPERTTVLLIVAAGMCVNRHRTIAFVS